MSRNSDLDVSERGVEDSAFFGAAADGFDVRIGGGPTTVRSFLGADLVDEMHVVVAPITLGAGVPCWKTATEFDDRFHHDTVPGPKASPSTLSGAAPPEPPN